MNRSRVHKTKRLDLEVDANGVTGSRCPLCGEWEEGLDLLVYAMCACCEAKLHKVFDENE
jgi:hypothetical protein